MRHSWFGMAWWKDRRKVVSRGRGRHLTRASAFVILLAFMGVGSTSAAASEFETWEGFSATNPMPAGRTPGGETSPFNLKIESPKVLSNSTAMVNFLLETNEKGNVPGTTTEPTGGSRPYYYASNSDPVVELNPLQIFGESKEGLEKRKIHVPASAEPEEYTAKPRTASDHHFTVILAPDDAKVPGETIDMWQAEREEGKITASSMGITNITGKMTDVKPGEGDAINSALLAGEIRAPEVKAGIIPHALLGVDNQDSDKHVYPAVGSDGTSENENAPPEGQRFYLDYTPAEIEAKKFPKWKQAELLALVNYGFYIGDSGNETLDFIWEGGTLMYEPFTGKEPFEEIAEEQGIPHHEGGYLFNISEGIEWTRLRAITPPPENFPPVVTTDPVLEIKSTGATLNGTVNPEEQETKYHFEYGLTESYGTKTAEASAGSGGKNVEESKTITGLTANTKYHFRIVGVNREGSVPGRDLTFTTS